MAIWHIGTANKRIAELEAEKIAIAKERDEALAALSGNTSEAIKAADQLQADLETAKASIASLTKERDASISAAAAGAKQISDLQTQLASKGGEVAIQVSRQSQQAQAALGQPALIAAPEAAAAPAGGRSNLKGMARITSAAAEDLQKAGYQRKN